MISANDVVFLSRTGEEKDYSGNKILYLGWYGSGAYSILEYAESYLLSADILFNEFKKSSGDYAKLDYLGIPIVFMYRHYCELIVKYLYIKYVHKVKSFASKDEYENDIKDFLNKGHRVIDLWNSTLPIISKLRSRVHSVVPIEALDSYFKQISTFDSDSMKMRYPIDKDLSAMINGHIKIDIFNLNDKMTGLAKAIEVLDGEIDNQIIHNAPIEQLDDCFQRIKKYSNNYEKYLSFLSNSIKEFDEDDLGCSPFEFIELTPEELEERRKKDEIITSLPDDALLILEALYYVGRDINQGFITLPKSRDESLYNILTMLLKSIDQQGHNLDRPLPDREMIDFWISKTNDAQLLNIRSSFGVVSPYLKCDNIIE